MTRFRPARPFALMVLVALLAGCGTRTPTVSSAKTRTGPTEDSLELLRDALRKTEELGDGRKIVEQFNVYLGRGSEPKPEALTAERRSQLAADFNLSPDDLAELARSDFTPLDANHFDQAFLFRDAARNLEVGSLTPADKARSALAWTVRNVRWVESREPPLPPQHVVLRGSGTPLERPTFCSPC